MLVQSYQSKSMEEKMKDSAQKIDYIMTYISAYENNIKLHNSCVFFDNAKLFELFAI